MTYTMLRLIIINELITLVYHTIPINNKCLEIITIVVIIIIIYFLIKNNINSKDPEVNEKR